MKKFLFASMCVLSAGMIDGTFSERDFDVRLNSILTQYLRCESMDQYVHQSISELIYDYSLAVSPEKRAKKLNQLINLREYHCEHALKLIEDLEKIADEEQERFKTTCFKATIGTLINSLQEKSSVTKSILIYLVSFGEDIRHTLKKHAEFYHKLNELKYHIEMYNFYNELIQRFDEVCPAGE